MKRGKRPRADRNVRSGLRALVARGQGSAKWLATPKDESCRDTAAMDKGNSERTVITSERRCQGHASHLLLKLWKDETFTAFPPFPTLIPPREWISSTAEARPRFDISYTLPSGLCARSLAEGTRIRIILLRPKPRFPGLQILPEVAIASRRARGARFCWSAKFRSSKFVTVALDTLFHAGGADENPVRKVAGRGKDIRRDGRLNRQMLAEHDAGLLSAIRR